MNQACGYHLTQLRKRQEAFELNVPQLEIPAGGVLCLLGPTGAGKSTLLRLLAGLDEPTGGEVWLNGQKVHPQRMPLSERRRIAMVAQRPLPLSGTVRHNVQYGLRLRRRRDPQRVRQILEQLELTHFAEQQASTLSGGQMQLVALARALVIDPDVLLLDEPTANLDPARVALVESVLRQQHAARRQTIVWATHNLFQARRVADQVAFLLGGQLIEVGDRERFFENPCDSRSADFILGKMVY